jgi:hypothetical protein
MGYAAIIAKVQIAASEQRRGLRQAQTTCDRGSAGQLFYASLFLLDRTAKQENPAADCLTPPLNYRQEEFFGPIFFARPAAWSDRKYRPALQRMLNPKILAPANCA